MRAVRGSDVAHRYSPSSPRRNGGAACPPGRLAGSTLRTSVLWPRLNGDRAPRIGRDLLLCHCRRLSSRGCRCGSPPSAHRLVPTRSPPFPQINGRPGAAELYNQRFAAEPYVAKALCWSSALHCSQPAPPETRRDKCVRPGMYLAYIEEKSLENLPYNVVCSWSVTAAATAIPPRPLARFGPAWLPMPLLRPPRFSLQSSLTTPRSQAPRRHQTRYVDLPRAGAGGERRAPLPAPRAHRPR